MYYEFEVLLDTKTQKPEAEASIGEAVASQLHRYTNIPNYGIPENL